MVVPLPEEIPLIAAGYAAHQGSVTLWGVALACWLAVVIGDVGTYSIGRGVLARLLRQRIVQRAVPPARRAWAEGFVERHGWRAIAIGRFLVGLRGFVFLAVGASRYSLRRFLAVDALVGLCEVGLIVGAGYLYGHVQKREATWLNVTVAIGLAVLLFGPPAWAWLRERRSRRRTEVPPSAA